MCGLLLVAARQVAVDPARARAGLDRLAHRGPDARALEAISLPVGAGDTRREVGIALGHARLSILDVDPRSNQPHHLPGSALLYNGEIYNFAAIRDDLARSGRRFATTGDTEVLHALLLDRGIAGLDEANGMWAFCRLDRDRGRILAARDRLGKKPLFYAMTDELLAIGSEIAAVVAALGMPARAAPGSIETYLAHGWLIPATDGTSHVAGVREVPPGGTLEIDLAAWRCKAGRWWTLEDHLACLARTPLAETLADAVLARLVSDREVGLLLSGGIDSTLILSVLAATGAGERVHCFVGDAGKSEDAAYALECLDELGLTATRIEVDYGQQSLAQLLDVSRHQQKPFPFIGSVLSMPQMYEAIRARGIPVVLDGSGGDEIFAGYPDRYLAFAVRDAVAAGDRVWLEEALAARHAMPRLGAIVAEGLSALARGEALAASPASALAIPYARPGALAAARNSDPLDGLAAGLDQALVTDTARGRLQEWLWHNDRNAMRSGVENRSPLLDHRLLPHLATGYRAKIAGAFQKRELREAFDRFRPLPSRHRTQKQGFRWVYSRFLRQNRQGVVALIAASRLLARLVDLPRYLDDVARSETLLLDEVTLRFLGVASFEAANGVVA
jgi:asparagine synthase (glutamine-hydrolysing)